METKLYKLITILIVILITGCNEPKNQYSSIKDGDILFRGNNLNGLSKAINEVTKTNKRTNYTHMGICSVNSDIIWVYHASPDKGVCKELLETFCQPDSGAQYVIDQYRLNDTNADISKAINKAEKLLGLPYDSTYLMENRGYYCSEYIYDLFREDSIFELNPMTFINPATGKFHDEWVSHYKNLNIEIPEGKPGCNPNHMATNKKLNYIKTLHQ